MSRLFRKSSKSRDLPERPSNEPIDRVAGKPREFELYLPESPWASPSPKVLTPIGGGGVTRSYEKSKKILITGSVPGPGLVIPLYITPEFDLICILYWPILGSESLLGT